MENVPGLATIVGCLWSMGGQTGSPETEVADGCAGARAVDIVVSIEHAVVDDEDEADWRRGQHSLMGGDGPLGQRWEMEMMVYRKSRTSPPQVHHQSTTRPTLGPPGALGPCRKDLVYRSGVES